MDTPCTLYDWSNPELNEFEVVLNEETEARFARLISVLEQAKTVEEVQNILTVSPVITGASQLLSELTEVCKTSSPLKTACEKGYTTAVRFLLDKGVDYAQNKHEAMRIAYNLNNFAIVDLLVRRAGAK